MKRIGTFLFLLLGSLFVDPIATSLGSGSNVFVTQSQAQEEAFHNVISQPGFANAPYSSYDPEFFTGFSTPPVVQARYFVINGMCHLWITTLTHGISNGTTANGVTFELPFTSANTVSQNAPVDVIYKETSGGRQAAKGLVVIPANSNVATVYVDFSTTALWATSGDDQS